MCDVSKTFIDAMYKDDIPYRARLYKLIHSDSKSQEYYPYGRTYRMNPTKKKVTKNNKNVSDIIDSWYV